MPLSVQVVAGVAGVLHIAIFAMESVLFTRPVIWRRFLVASQSDADTIRPWAFNQGFYNLFLAAGALGGIVMAAGRGTRATGTAITLFACLCMIAAAVVLVSTDRRMLRPALIQAGPALVAVVLAAAL